MSKANLILAMTAALGLAACTNDADMAARNANLVPLLDNTGRAVVFAPASAVGNAPVGTPVVINRGGSQETVTVGARQGGTSAGNISIVGSDAGSPQIVRVGGTGNAAQEGSAVVTGSQGGTLTTTRAPVGTGLSPRQRRAMERARAAEGTTATPAATPAR